MRAETLKYLYLLHSNASHLGDFFVFSTEGHLMAPLSSSQASLTGAGAAWQSLCTLFAARLELHTGGMIWSQLLYRTQSSGLQAMSSLPRRPDSQTEHCGRL